VLLFCSCAKTERTIWLDQMDISFFEAGWNNTKVNSSIEGNPISIAGTIYNRGVGTHSPAVGLIHLDGKANIFEATVGVDDETLLRGEVEFFVVTKDRVLWQSGTIKGGEKAKKVSLDISGLEYLGLLTTSSGDDINFDHADWANARILYGGDDPQFISNFGNSPVVLTPRAPLTPCINGPGVIGVRPGNPLDYCIAATGERPLHFKVSNLPSTLHVDKVAGRIRGVINDVGKYVLQIQVSNARGKAQKELEIVVGEQICLTPPMGWNSWYCWSESVSQDKIIQTAKAMMDKGLVDYGWSYINIDDCWQGARGGEYCAIQGNQRFPDIKQMCDTIHDMGLKMGIYSTPWMGSYAGFIGGSAPTQDGDYSSLSLPLEKRLQQYQLFGRYPGTHKRGTDIIGPYWLADADHRQWAQWGIDMVKYDWNPNDVPTTQKLASSLRRCGRDIVLSLSNNAPFKNVDRLSHLAQMWRTTGDIHDSWQSISSIGFSQDRWAPFGGPGHWNDPDMLQLGKKGVPNRYNRELVASNLTPDEQYTQMSLWCMLSAPLLLSCDIGSLDDFTLSLLTNGEVLALDQDPLGKAAITVLNEGGIRILKKELASGDIALGVFYTQDVARPLDALDYFYWGGAKMRSVTVALSQLTGVTQGVVRDLWRCQDLGSFSREITIDVPWHGVRLLLIKK